MIDDEGRDGADEGCSSFSWGYLQVRDIITLLSQKCCYDRSNRGAFGTILSRIISVFCRYPRQECISSVGGWMGSRFFSSTVATPEKSHHVCKNPWKASHIIRVFKASMSWMSFFFVYGVTQTTTHLCSWKYSAFMVSDVISSTSNNTLTSFTLLGRLRQMLAPLPMS